MKKISINILKIYFYGIFRDLIKIISRAFINSLSTTDLQKIIAYRFTNDVEKEKALVNKAIKNLQDKISLSDFEKSPSIK